MATRRAGAPRLIEWTGERCVPWAPDVPVVYEHYHRYLWARHLAAGARVLDVGSGEGFGAALLAEAAAAVTGIDIAADAVEHAQANYEAPNLEFRVGSAADLSAFADDAFDLVVAFEVIEHVAEQEEVIAGIARVLAPGGRLVISTPDRDAYAERGEPNPFHERELGAAEFDALLAAEFPERRHFMQRTLEGSRIEAVEPDARGPALPLQIERVGDEWREAPAPRPLYLVAVAAARPLSGLPADSTLADFGLEYLRSKELEEALARGEALNATRERDLARQEAGEARAELARLAGTIDERQRELLDMAQGRDTASRELALARRELASIRGSIAWSLFQRVQRRLRTEGGERTLLGRLASAGLRAAMARRQRATAAAGPAPAHFDPLVLPPCREPAASIVIPVHSGARLTEQCLRSILHSVDDLAYEVILVDDAADADTKALLAAVQGGTVITNERNLGYLKSTNRGAEAARGRHIVLLNNDTEPQVGWLRALVDRAESSVDVGVVVAKLLYPDGSLQEAGGIVWRDGTAWNYGNGGDAWTADVLSVRPVDYGSAAAMLVRREMWTDLGGFDERFSPGYWEDVDLCFAARAGGWQVLYEPQARVIHHEGASMGTDTAAGGKRHQVANAPVFAAKWRDALAAQPAGPSRDRAHLASDRRRGPNVLVIDHQVPMPDRDAGSLRMLRLLENLQALGFRVTFLSDNGVLHQPYTDRLRALGVEVLNSPLDVQACLADLGSRLRLAILSRPYVAARYLHLVRRHAPDAKVAYDTVDLHFAREARRAEQADDGPDGVADAFRHLEIAMARAADVTLTVSEAERAEVEAVAGAPAAIVPLANEVWPDVPGPEGREGILFVGGFSHEPNVGAAVQLAEEIMPLVWRELPDVTLTIVGGNAPPQVQALASPGVDVAGWVEDLDPLLRQARVSAAPVRFGAGANGKVAQSLGAGLPVVTTALGAAGFAADDGVHLFTADSSELMARRIVELHRDAAVWRAMSRAGRDLIAATCSPEAQRGALRAVTAELGVLPPGPGE